MRSICLKTNNEEIISYIIQRLENEFDDIIISENQFKIYKNVIIHYVGQNERNFLIQFSETLADVISVFYEKIVG